MCPVWLLPSRLNRLTPWDSSLIILPSLFICLKDVTVGGLLFLSLIYVSQAFTLSISYLFIGLGFIIIDLFDKFPTAFSFSFLFFTVAVGRMYLRKSFSFSTFGFTRDLFLYFQKLASLLIEFCSFPSNFSKIKRKR